MGGKEKLTISTDRCSGCMACKDICPADCIYIRTDNKGNFYRIIDKKKCKSCNLCEKVCPIINTYKLHMPQKAYVAWHKKVCINRKSSSGGVAAGIYEYCIENNIKCIGARYNEELKVKYDFIDSLESINDFVGSKYVHSDMTGIYKQIVSLLNSGEKIVFIGLPCHVAALQNIAKDKNLLCVDLVCHGVVAEKFLAEHIENMKGEKIKKNTIGIINFREEKNQYGITVRGKNGKLLKSQTKEQDEYMLGFCKGFIYCEECYRCRYARKQRCSDLTIKDFTGRKTGKLLRQKYGLSSILVNTDHGKEFVERLNSYLNMLDYSVKEVIKTDSMLKKPAPRGKKRDIFLKMYPLLGFDLTVKVLCVGAIFKERLKIGRVI